MDQALRPDAPQELINQLNDATRPAHASRAPDGKISSLPAHLDRTLIIAPHSDPRLALPTNVRLPHGFKVVGYERSAVRAGVRGAPFACSVRHEDGRCVEKKYFKRMHSLASKCDSGALDCSNIRFRSSQKRVLNPETNVERRYAHAVVSTNEASKMTPDEIASPADIARVERARAKRASSTDPLQFIHRDASRRNQNDLSSQFVRQERELASSIPISISSSSSIRGSRTVLSAADSTQFTDIARRIRKFVKLI